MTDHKNINWNIIFIAKIKIYANVKQSHFCIKYKY